MERIDRRAAIGLLAAAATFPAGAAAAPPEMRMWRDPGCGCCAAWARKMEAAFGVPLSVTDVPDMAALKSARGVPLDLRSCHTALIGGYVIEGHVPPEDVRRLLSARPAGLKGLAVPGMPMGSPGMEMGGTEPYRVIAFAAGGRRSVFAAHGR